MYIVLGITTLVFFVIIRILILFQDKIKFYTIGSDEGFSFSEISMLWRLAKETQLEDPISLYVSMPTVNMAISKLILDSRRDGTENAPRTQSFLTHLYNFRTKISLAHDNKKGLESTRYLNNGQKLRIVLRGHGVFSSQILNNGRDIIIKTPSQNNIIKIPSENWVGKMVIVYLWRKGDAHYVFDTRVTDSGLFSSQPVIHLAQTTKLLRTQKRRSVRAACNISADLFFLQANQVDYNAVDTDGGYKCLLEDISEDGALIRVGGRGTPNVRIKLQFLIGDMLIMMFGVVRAVEFNKDIHQSRLHFECMHLEKDMKNAVLSFVYNILPQNEREELEAITGTEEDEGQDTAALEAELESIADEVTAPVEIQSVDTAEAVKPMTDMEPL